LLPITTSSLDNCPEPAFITFLPGCCARTASRAASLKAEDSQIAIAQARWAFQLLVRVNE
jgi:hypothetical protein